MARVPFSSPVAVYTSALALYTLYLEDTYSVKQKFRDVSNLGTYTVRESCQGFRVYIIEPLITSSFIIGVIQLDQAGCTVING